MKTKKGFTLVELVIVIAVIAVLAAVLIPTFSGIMNRAKENALLQKATHARDEYISSNEGVYVFNIEGCVVQVEDSYYQIDANGELNKTEVSDLVTLTEIQNTGVSDTNIHIYEKVHISGYTVDGKFIPFTKQNLQSWFGIVTNDENYTANIRSVNRNSPLSEAESIILPDKYYVDDTEYTITSTGGTTSGIFPGTGRTARYFPHLKSVVVPDSYTVIGKKTFCEAAIESITLPNTITTIGNAAFLKCYNLKELILPDSVEFVDFEAISQCTSLEKLSFGNGLKYLASKNIYNCPNITSITLPKSLTYLCYGFSNCLTELFIEGGTKWELCTDVRLDWYRSNIIPTEEIIAEQVEIAKENNDYIVYDFVGIENYLELPEEFTEQYSSDRFWVRVK